MSFQYHVKMPLDTTLNGWKRIWFIIFFHHSPFFFLIVIKNLHNILFSSSTAIAGCFEFRSSTPWIWLECLMHIDFLSECFLLVDMDKIVKIVFVSPIHKSEVFWYPLLWFGWLLIVFGFLCWEKWKMFSSLFFTWDLILIFLSFVLFCCWSLQ